MSGLCADLPYFCALSYTSGFLKLIFSSADNRISSPVVAGVSQMQKYSIRTSVQRQSVSGLSSLPYVEVTFEMAENHHTHITFEEWKQRRSLAVLRGWKMI